MKLRKPIFLLRSLLLSGMAVLTACGRNDTATLEGELDYMIRNKRLFDEKKEERIDGFRRMLCMTRLTPEQEYAINDSLSEVFYKYRLDSAIRYGERNLELARRLGDRERCASAAIRLARFYSSRGACIEARQLLDSIRRELPPDFLELFTGPTSSSTTATGSSPAPAGRRTTGRFTGIRSGGISESRPIRPKPGSRPNNGC